MPVSNLSATRSEDQSGPLGGSGHQCRPKSDGLRRDIEILEQLGAEETAGRGGLGVVAVAERLGLDKSQVSRALRALEAEGMTERDPGTLEYRLGWRLYALAARTTETRLVQLAAPFMRRLVAALDETAHLCVLRGLEVLTLQSVAPSHAFRGLGSEGVTVPAPRTSAGRVLMSDWQPETLRRWLTPSRLPAGIPGQPAGTPGQAVRSTADLLREVAFVRKHGYAKVDEEFEPGLVGVSAPVTDFRGLVVAAINVSAPKARLGRRLDYAGRLSAAIARELSAALSGSAGGAALSGSAGGAALSGSAGSPARSGSAARSTDQELTARDPELTARTSLRDCCKCDHVAVPLQVRHGGLLDALSREVDLWRSWSTAPALPPKT
jgi:DNA-binding IclR family transcriptional regulator